MWRFSRVGRRTVVGRDPQDKNQVDVATSLWKSRSAKYPRKETNKKSRQDKILNFSLFDLLCNIRLFNIATNSNGV
jgi:hypothetical protein